MGIKMAGVSNSKLRILSLLDILITQTDEEHILSAAELSALLEQQGIPAERKTIYSDIKLLNECNHKIVHVTSPSKGYYYANRSTSPADARYIIDSLRTASFISQHKKEMIVNSMLKLISTGEREVIENQIDGCFCRDFSYGDSYAAIYTLSKAISRGKQVSFTFARRMIDCNRKIVRSEIRVAVNPYAVFCVRQGYFLICNIPSEDRIIHLPIEGVRFVTVLPTDVRNVRELEGCGSGLDVSEYVRRHYNYRHEGAERVVIKCSRKLIDKVVYEFGESFEIVETDKTSFTFAGDMTIDLDLINWIGSLGPDIEVLSPPSLRKTIFERINTVLAIYANSTEG